MMGSAVLLVSGLLLISSSAFAVEAAPNEGFESYSLGEVYIKGEKPPITQQATITNVITAEDIKATNSETVAEALAFAPGLRVTSGRKNEPSVSLHGIFNQNRILILIDGVPYYETKYGSLDLNQFTTDNVAKIEITKGAASVLYGANAMGGVINIITKQPVGEPTFSVNVEAGEVDYYKASASHGMNTGRFNYWINYEHRQAHGWRMSDDFTPRTATVSLKPGKTTYPTVTEDGGTRNQSDYVTDSIWAKFGLTPTKDSEYSVNFHYISREKGNPPDLNAVTVFPNQPAFSNFFRFPTYNDWGIDLSGVKSVTSQLKLKAKMFYHNHVDELESFLDETFSQSIALSKYQDYIIGGSLIAEYSPVNWNIVRLAGNFKGDSHKQRDVDYLPFENFFSWTGSVGIEDEMSLSKEFSIVVGASYDWFKITDANQNNTDSSGQFINQTPLTTKPTVDSFNPMIGATYTFADTTKLFASVARKTRFPTLNDLYASASKGGNPELKAETAINSTIGASRPFGKFAWGELAFFYHDISDLIDRSGPNKTDKFVNIGKVEVYGIEVNTELYPVEDLVLKVAYNFNHATDQSSPKVTDKVRNVPEHKLDLGAQYTVPVVRTRLDLNGILFSNLYSQVPTVSRPSDPEIQSAGFFVLNARVTQKFLKNFEAYLAVNNIFDRNYEPEAGFTAPGRNIFGGLTASF
jgi:outer membrane receptor protein involved in Fe transport